MKWKTQKSNTQRRYSSHIQRYTNTTSLLHRHSYEGRWIRDYYLASATRNAWTRSWSSNIQLARCIVVLFANSLDCRINGFAGVYMLDCFRLFQECWDAKPKDRRAISTWPYLCTFLLSHSAITDIWTKIGKTRINRTRGFLITTGSNSSRFLLRRW